MLAPPESSRSKAAQSGALAFGHIALTPAETRALERPPPPERLSNHTSGGSGGADGFGSSGGATSAPQHSHVVQLLWRPPPPAPATLRLEPQELFFGDVEVGGRQPTPLTFHIYNDGAAEVNFVLMLTREEPAGGGAPTAVAKASALEPPPPRKPPVGTSSGSSAETVRRPPSVQPFLLQPRNGFIAGGQACRIEVNCRAPQPGPLKYIVVVRNVRKQSGQQQDHTLRIRARGVHPRHLHFPDLIAEHPELALGLCYVQLSAADASLQARVTADGGGGAGIGSGCGVVPFRISNLSGEPRVLTVTSNLAKQVFVFADEGCMQRADDVPLPASGTVTVWVAVQPHRSVELLAGRSRNLVGGMRVQVRCARVPANPPELTRISLIARPAIPARSWATRAAPSSRSALSNSQPPLAVPSSISHRRAA